MNTNLVRALAFLVCALFLTQAAEAQQPGKVPRVGVLFPGSSTEGATIQREPFERGLRELGWIPGSTVRIDYRYAEGNVAALSELAMDLARSGTNVIVARGPAAVRAVRQVTSTIPIVMSAGEDPVAEGFAKSLSRPGGNVTGILTYVFELDNKRLELLKEAFPKISRVAVLANPNADSGSYEERMTTLQNSARGLKVQIQLFEIRRAEEIAEALAAIGQARVDALLVRADPQVLDHYRREIAAMAAKHRLPAMYPWRFFAEAGGLMSYGTSLPGFHHRSAAYVSRILKGAHPGELPIEQPTQFELVINAKAANALGISMPHAFTQRAVEFIQ